MSGDSARITITSGPDRGRTFQLVEELIHIGQGSENHIALSDPSVADHQASIVNRNGRYAIYTPTPDVVYVDGSVIPAERWVWLPSAAQVRLSERTSFQFREPSSNGDGGSPPPPASGDGPSTSTIPRPRTKPPRAKTKAKTKPAVERSVARFITDQAGDALVKLGEDGHLPELHLSEGENSRKKAERQQQREKSSPSLLYIALGVSFVASLAMLLFDPPASVSVQDRALARQELRQFYETGDGEPKPYQALLRQARLAHSRGDFAAERAAYRRVLTMLNAEDVINSYEGLTGDREKNDQQLKKLLTTLLSE